MELDKVIKSTNFFEFLNNVDDLINKLLYSEEGFLTLKDKDTIINFENYIDKFENEFSKLSQQTDLDSYYEIYNEKREEFINKINNHTRIEISNWVEKTYDLLITNCLQEIELNKENKKNIDKYYNRGLLSIEWISRIKNLNKKEKNELIKSLNLDIKEIFSNTKENKNQNINKTNPEFYLKIRNLIKNNLEEFLKIDFNLYQNELSKEDILKLNLIQNNISGIKKTQILDEIQLIDSAITILNLKSPEDIFNFIKEIENEFNLFISNNKKIEEDDKINIVKRRILLYKNSSKYYQDKLLT